MNKILFLVATILVSLSGSGAYGGETYESQMSLYNGKGPRIFPFVSEETKPLYREAMLAMKILKFTVDGAEVKPTPSGANYDEPPYTYTGQITPRGSFIYLTSARSLFPKENRQFLTVVRTATGDLLKDVLEEYSMSLDAKEIIIEYCIRHVDHTEGPVRTLKLVRNPASD